MRFELNEVHVNQKRILMNRRRLLLTMIAWGLAFGGLLEGSDLIVEVNYSRFGNRGFIAHKVYVAVWDTPEFTRQGSQVQPLKTDSISAKSGTVHFNGLKKSPVYVSAVFDPTGKWDAKTALPPEAARGLYGKKRGAPEPIQLSTTQTATVSFTLSDRSKTR